jgi:hypothetical protein
MKDTPEIKAAKTAYENAVNATKELQAKLDAATRAQNLAYSEIRKAMTARDMTLPQCDAVSIPWHQRCGRSTQRVVILRQTKAGTIFVRPIGVDDDGDRYKPDGNGVYRLITNDRGSHWLEDLPEQYK